MSNYYMNIVELMVDNPDKELLTRLSRVAELCNSAGGILASRQIIATIVEQYEREIYNQEINE